MSARILYVEEKVFDPNHEIPSQLVRVELRQWKDSAHHDTIIEKRVVVDGAEAVCSSRVLGGYSDAAHIRHAISTFDELCSAHPWATKENAR